MMGNREKSRVNFELSDIPLFSMWTSWNETGFNFGFRLKNFRDIHLTAFYKNNVLNCHITDNGIQVWKETFSITDLIVLGNEILAYFCSCYVPYTEDQKYMQLSPEMMQMGNDYDKIFQSGKWTSNWDGVLNEVMSENFALIEKTIFEGFQKGQIPGIIEKNDQLCICIPFTPEMMFVMDIDIENTPLIKTPILKGFYKFIEYLDNNNILEQAGVISEEKKQEIKSAILLTGGSLELDID